MKSKNLQAFCSAFLGLALVLNASAQSTIVPDEVNVPKYTKIWLEAKATSDGLRAQAEELRARAQQIDNDIATTQQAIVDSQKRISENTSTIQNLQNEVPVLRGEISAITRDTADRRGQISANLSVIQGYQTELHRLNGEHVMYSREYENNTLPRLRQLERRLERVSTDLEEGMRAMQQLIQNKKAWEDKLAELEQRRNQLASEIAALEAEQPQVQQKIQQLTHKVGQLAAQVQGAQAAATQAQQQLNQANANKQAAQQNLQSANGQLQSAQQALQQAEQALAGAQATLTAKQNKKQELQQEIPALSQAIANVGNQLQALAQQIQAQQALAAAKAQELQQLQGQIQNLAQVLVRANQAVHNIQQQIAEMTKQFQANQERIKELGGGDGVNEGDINPENRKEIARLRQENRKLREAIGNLQQQLQPAQSAAQRAKDALAQAQSKIAQVNQEKSAAEQAANQLQQQQNEIQKNLPTMQQRLQQLQGQLQAINQELPALLQAVQTAEQEKQSRAAALAQVQQSIAPLQAAVAAANQAAAQAAQNLQGAQQQLQGLQGQLQQAQNGLQQNQARAQEIAQQLPQKRQMLGANRHKFQEATQAWQQTEVAIGQQRDANQDLRGRKQQLAHETQQMADFARQQYEFIQALAQQIAQYEASIGGLNQENASLEYQIARNDQALRERQDRIAYNQSEWARLGQENQRLAQSIVEQERWLSETEPTSPLAWAAFQAADDKARTAEAVTAQKLADLKATHARYNAQLADAQALGAGQGQQLGAGEGRDAGDLAGQNKGSLEGKTAGTQEGLEAGYLAGLQDGFKVGKDQGYEHGLNAPENFEAGELEGLEQGRKDAYARARQVAYPEGRKQTREKIMAVPPTRKVVVDQRNGRQLSDSGSSRSAWDLASLFGVQPESRNELSDIQVDMNADFRAPEDPEQALANKIRAVERKLTEMRKNADQSLGQEAPTPQVEGDEKRAQCNGLFIDFYNACRASFKATYEQAYVELYKEAYTPSRDESFSRQRDVAYQANLQSRFKVGRDESYPVMFAKYDAIGAREARASGYQKGKTDGYNQTIEQANKEEFQNGVDAEKQFFASNAVVTVQGVKVDPVNPQEEFTPSSKVTLSLALTNFGQISTGQSVKVNLRPYGGLTLDDNYLELASIPAEAQAEVVNVVKGTVSNDVQPGQAMGVRATVTLPDGSTVERRFEVKAKLHVKLQANLDYNKTPSVTAFLGAIDTHEVYVTLTNQSLTDTRESFLVQLLADPADPGIAREVTIETTDQGVESLGRNETSKRVKLQYHMSKALKGKTVILKVRVLYGRDRVLAHEETLELRVKR